MRGDGEISHADLVRVGVATEQILDTCAISAGCRTEDAVEPRLTAGPARGGERVLFIQLVARGYSLHSRIEKRDLGREEIAKQAGNAPGDVDAGAARGSSRQHFDAGDATAGMIPDRPAAQERQALRDFLAAGA